MLTISRRMTNCCHKKCVSTNYREPSLEKGELVCIDRCVAKYLDIHEQIGKKLTVMSQTDEEILGQAQKSAAQLSVKK